MNVTRPNEWVGSDLRARTDVVQYLRRHGGEVTDQTGLVAGTMRQELGKGRALSQLLADMENDGMIEREVRGRRTFRITLKDDWGLAPAIAPVPDLPEPDAAGFDYDQLAAALLAIAMKRASTPPAPAPDKTLTDRLKRAEKALDGTETRLAEVSEERNQLRERCQELEEQNRILTHNVEVLQKKVDKPSRTGPTIAERLSAEELQLLSQLQQEMPATPQSKPRRTRTR